MRPAVERRADFGDVLLPYTEVQARWEAGRCLGCHDAPCTRGCPAGVDVRRFVQLLRLGEARAAGEVIRRGGNVLASSCARVCDGADECQGRCTRGKLDAPIDIPGLERFAADCERRAGARPLPVGTGGRSVAVVGSGPAGLAAASELRRLGHTVALLEARAAPGGRLVRAYPPFRLPREVVEAELAAVLATGVDLQLEAPVAAVGELLERFDAVILAIGAGQPLKLGVDGEDLAGAFGAAALISGQVCEVGLRPMVIGGGTGAMDAAMTALRLAGPQGRVTVLYRRSFQQMPASPLARQMGWEEGVVLRPLTVVERILGDREGRVAAVRCRAVDLGPEDGSGRPGPVVLSGGTFDLGATSVIIAAGEEPDPALLAALGLTEAEPRGDGEGRTAVARLYVAGDVVAGPRGVCWAVGSGVRAARAVDLDLCRGNGRPRLQPVLGPEVELSVEFLGKRLRNPFLLAASPCTDDLEMARDGLRAGFAGLVLRTTRSDECKVEPRYPEVAPIADGTRRVAALGSLALASRHTAGDLEAMLGALRAEFPDRFIAASIAGESKTQWQKLARQVAAAGADAIECNFLVPQGTLGPKPSALVGQDPSLVRIVTRWVKDVAGEVPVVVKIAPQVGDLAEVARAVAEGGGDGLCAAGTMPGVAGVDVETATVWPSVGGRTAMSGIQGPAILPFSLRSIAEVARATTLPVSGSGGVESWRDAAAQILLGATTVQLCTAVLHHGLGLIEELEDGLARYLERQRAERVGALVGKAVKCLVAQAELVQPGPVRAQIDRSSCLGCGRCHVACRDGARRAITFSERREPSVLLERCTGCGLCSGVCPSDSITYLTL